MPIFFVAKSCQPPLRRGFNRIAVLWKPFQFLDGKMDLRLRLRRYCAGALRGFEDSTAELVPAALSSGCSSEGTIVNTPFVLVTSIEATSASSRFKSAMSCDEEAVVDASVVPPVSIKAASTPPSATMHSRESADSWSPVSL